MIKMNQYFLGKTHVAEDEVAADDLLVRVNEVLFDCHQETTYDFFVCPHTGTLISGAAKGGTGGGGFRLPDEGPTPKSSHKEAKAVDVYDPGEIIDGWLTDEKLESYGLYREHPDKTPGWCHLTTRAPGSGHRTFYP